MSIVIWCLNGKPTRFVFLKGPLEQMQGQWWTSAWSKVWWEDNTSETGNIFGQIWGSPDPHPRMTFTKYWYWLVVWNHGILWLSIYIYILYWECRHPKWLYFFRGVGIPPTRNISAVGFRQFLVSVKFLLGRNESHHDCMMIGQFCSPTLGRFWRLHLLQGHQLDSKQIHQAHHDTHSCICFSHFSHLIVLLSHSFHFLIYQFYWVIFTSLPSLFPKLSPAGCRMSIGRSGIHIFPA